MACNRVKRSEKGRPVCIELGCDIETLDHEKRCAPHDWRLRTWLERSRKLLDEAKAKGRRDDNANDDQ